MNEYVLTVQSYFDKYAVSIIQLWERYYSSKLLPDYSYYSSFSLVKVSIESFIFMIEEVYRKR